jgi:hypothetical protein
MSTTDDEGMQLDNVRSIEMVEDSATSLVEFRK